MIKRLAVLAALTSVLTGAAQASITNPASTVVRVADQQTDPLVVADARSYRHCHNIHTRVYCHKADRLPMNWPPFSDRAGTNVKGRVLIEPKKPCGCAITRGDACRQTADRWTA